VLSNPGSSIASAGNAGLINGMADYGFSQDANGMWVMNPADTTKNTDVSNATSRWNALKETLGLTPQKENVMQSPEIQAQNALVEQRQSEVNNATSQLNNIVAKQQQDLLSVRGTGSREGVTEAVYGGQQATINREAAIAALPIQAALAGAQGNLQLAQQHLDTLVKMKTEEVNNDYAYKVMQFDAIKEYVTGEQKIQLSQMEKENDRAYAEKQDLIKVQSTLMASAVQQKAPSSVVQAISSATTQMDAISAAGVFGGDMMAQQIQRAQLSKLQTEAAALNNPAASDSIVSDPNSASILAQTGLSMPAFAYLTQGTTALTRMTASQRLQYINEAQNWANTKGIDVSTLKSQYSALGKTVEANVLRNNQAKVAESEIDATLTNLKEAAQAEGLSSLKVANVAKLFAGKQFNDNDVTRYAFHLNQLRNEMAMYNAAAAGQIDANGNIREIAKSEMDRIAEQTITNGIANGGIDGLETALKASVSKMGTVLQSSISAQNRQVWDLFGVGSNYKNTGQNTNTGTNTDFASTTPNYNADLAAAKAAIAAGADAAQVKARMLTKYAQVEL
jgi:hypothetical protein